MTRIADDMKCYNYFHIVILILFNGNVFRDYVRSCTDYKAAKELIFISNCRTHVNNEVFRDFGSTLYIIYAVVDATDLKSQKIIGF